MVEIREVASKGELRDFIRLPWKIYRDDPNWIPPIIADVKATLDREKSPFFEFGEAAYFTAYRDGECVGRISAHVNRIHNDYHKANDGFFGFFESINDDEVSRLLLDAAAEWVRHRGMSRLVGPASFTIYDEPCFMVEGWEADPPTPVIFQNYNPRYYIDLMAKAGFEKEIDWYAYRLDAGKPLSRALLGAKERAMERRGLVFRNVNLKRVDEEVEKIKAVFNDAWSENWGHHPYTERQAEQIKEALKLIVDPRMCFIVETQEGKPVGCAVILPDLNPFVKKMNGRILPFGWIHLLWGRRHSSGSRAFMLGVLKEYRNSGVDVALIVEAMQRGPIVGYEWGECSLIVETNQSMIRLIEKWGGDRYKTYRLFGKSLA